LEAPHLGFGSEKVGSSLHVGLVNTKNFPPVVHTNVVENRPIHAGSRKVARVDYLDLGNRPHAEEIFNPIGLDGDEGALHGFGGGQLTAINEELQKANSREDCRKEDRQSALMDVCGTNAASEIDDSSFDEDVAGGFFVLAGVVPLIFLVALYAYLERRR